MWFPTGNPVCIPIREKGFSRSFPPAGWSPLWNLSCAPAGVPGSPTELETPTGTWCEDAWLTASALLAETERLKFLVAFRPGLVPPTLAAQQTATLQRFSEGRVLLNVVSGGDDLEQQRFGDWLSHDERYSRTAEFLEIVNRVWREESVDFSGAHYTVKDARVSEPPNPLPQIYFGGSSAAALPIAAEHVDVYLTWGEPPANAAAKIAEVRADRSPWPAGPVRDPSAHHHPGHLRGRVGGGRRIGQAADTGSDRQSDCAA